MKLKKSQVMLFREALRKIAELDPAKDSANGFNEWGEAELFREAQLIAARALNEEKSR